MADDPRSRTPATRPAGLIDRAVATGIHKLDDSARRLREARARPSAASGHVTHDDRGNAIWNIAIDAGVAALEGTSRLLRKLDLPELALEDDAAKSLALQDPGGGYNPYDRRGSRR